MRSVTVRFQDSVFREMSEACRDRQGCSLSRFVRGAVKHALSVFAGKTPVRVFARDTRRHTTRKTAKKGGRRNGQK